MAVIFIMLDGVGLAPSSTHNPVARAMPHISQALGTPLGHPLDIDQPLLYAKGIDATLGVPGLPQSGSGHAAIYGGFNAAAFNGRHQPHSPTIAMRERLARYNLLQVARQAGHRVAWANAYLPGYKEAVARRRLRHTAGTWSALHAGIELRGLQHLLDATAVSWDITQELARRRPEAAVLPWIAPQEAGMRLAALARDYDFVLFETYLPDLAAHKRLDVPVEDALGIVDGLLHGILNHCAVNDTLVVTSDHGNSEDTTTTVHTRNPVPLIGIGLLAQRLCLVQAIDQIAPALLALLDEARRCAS